MQSGGILGPHRHVGVTTATGDVLAALDVRITAVTAPTPPELLLAGVAGGGCHIGLDANDGLDEGVLVAVVLLGDLEELIGTEHVAMVGHRHSRHALTCHLGKQSLIARRTVQHGILGVSVQVHEVRTRHDDPSDDGRPFFSRPQAMSSWGLHPSRPSRLNGIHDGIRCSLTRLTGST